MTATAGTAEGKASWGLAATAVLAVLALLVALAAPAAAQENSNGNGNDNGEEEPSPEPEPEPDAIQARRLAGEDRYATAAEVARDAFEAPVAHALLARGDAFPDALAGSYLAGHLRAPILLTPPSALAEAASSVLAELQVGTVHLLGGPSAISPAVAAELSEAGYQVRRVSGTDRYATAAEIATVPQPGRVATIGGKRTALLASGVNFPDALSAGPLAYRGGVPLLLTHPEALVAPAEEALTTLGIEQVLVLGGAAAISPAVLTALGQRGVSTRRLAGPTRVETAAAVADYLLAELAWDAAGVRLARANEFPDGLSGAPHAGESFAPILLTPTDGLHPGAERWLTRHAGVIEDVAVFGGVAAVSDGAVSQTEQAASTVGPNHAYDVTEEAANLALGAARTCTVTAPIDAIVHLRLVPAANAYTLDDGRVMLKDVDPPDGRADTDADLVQASIRAVGGAEQEAGTVGVDDVRMPTGELRVTLASDAVDHVRVLAFSDRVVGAAGALDLDDTVMGVPVEPFGLGCETSWYPTEATQGRHTNVRVTRVDPEGGAFVGQVGEGAPMTFRFTDADQFEIMESPVTRGNFADVVSDGDRLTADYGTRSGGTSRFNITFDDVKAPAAAVAEVIESDVHIRWVPPGDNGAGTRFRVEALALSEACSLTDKVRGVTLTADPFVVDRSVGAGCWQYRIWPASPAGASPEFTFTDPVVLPAPQPEEDRPTSQSAFVTIDRAPTGRLGAGDVIGITFDMALARPRPGASITVRDEDGVTATMTHGADAIFLVDDAGTTLTVRLFRDPPAVPSLPADITGHTGIASEHGETWDVATSPDRRLESGTAPPEEDPPDEEEDEEPEE